MKLLPAAELAEVLASPHSKDLFIGAALSDEGVVLYRGNLEELVVPLAWFTSSSGSAPKADANDLEIIDCGQTVRLGEFEAASDAILYDFDEDYRTRGALR